jgi:hypothetical protein
MRDLVRDRLAREQRDRQVAVRDVVQPIGILHDDRPIQPIKRSDLLDMLQRSILSCQGHRRIARHEIEHAEDEKSREQCDRRQMKHAVERPTQSSQ